MKEVLQHVLLIDDDEVSNFTTTIDLRMYNPAVKVDVCLNGKDAMDYFDACVDLPELVLLDVNMPLKNGWDFLDWLNSNYDDKFRSNVIMYSTSTRYEDMEKCKSYDFVLDYLEKPLDESKLRVITKLMA